ncbi:MAG: hypothetical protein J6I50_08355 [Clostridia bacterium]|nr:hypothetical protein [Clostridia bacterium]
MRIKNGTAAMIFLRLSEYWKCWIQKGFLVLYTRTIEFYRLSCTTAVWSHVNAAARRAAINRCFRGMR